MFDIVFLEKQQGQCHIIDIVVPRDACIEGKRKGNDGKVPGLKKSCYPVMACKCFCNACSGWGFGYGDEELTKESPTNRSDCKDRISVESGIAWNCRNFAKSFLGLRLQVVA